LASDYLLVSEVGYVESSIWVTAIYRLIIRER
jgi:hypothetical protein